MAKGKQVGELSAKFTSFTFGPGPHGTTILQANVEGTATGLGAVLGTGTFVLAHGKSGHHSGNYTYHGMNYHDDGEQTTLTGTGTYESIGKHRWRTQAHNAFLSNGQTFAFEGEIDLAGRLWTGKIFEQS